MRRIVAGVIVAMLVGCGTEERSSDPQLASLLVPEFGPDAEAPTFDDRTFEIGEAVAFARGSWEAPQHRMFESVQAFESRSLARAAFEEGRILGRLTNSLVRTDVEIAGADSAFIDCVDQEKYGASTCDFPALLVLIDNFVFTVTGGNEESRWSLAEEIPASLAQGWAEVCASNVRPTWCAPGA